MSLHEKYACPCCGYTTLDEPPPGTYGICPVCYWEDDAVQYHDPDYAGGANQVSLRQAQANFRTFGAESRASLRFVRKPTEDERRAQDEV
ncbi:MAG TPA: CPCC family cysteine-rich protein [Herpetosiphonaceae bacterium]